MDVETLLAGVRGHFIENLGQLDNPRVLFYAQGDPLSVGLTSNSLLFTLSGPERIAVFELSFVGCNEIVPVGRVVEQHVVNYLRGNDPDQWVRGARSFSEVVYGGIYEDVDLRFYFTDGMFKYDFIVGKGADATQIHLRYEGIDGLEVDGLTGDLLVHTGIGTVRDMAPVIIHDENGAEVMSDAGFHLQGDDGFGFLLPSEMHDNEPFIIDPGLEFGTYIGGSGEDEFDNMVLDDEGNIYLVGRTYENDFPTLPGCYDPVFGGDTEGVLVVLDPKGTQLLVSTYVGGSDQDSLSDISIMPNGTLLCLGYTLSTDFPITPGSAMNNSHNGDSDVVLMVFDSVVSNLLYGTYIGGSGEDYSKMMTVLSDGGVVITGKTASDDLPAREGSFCETHHGDDDEYDAYVMRVNASLRSIDFSTYVGGSGDEEYICHMVDGRGHIYLDGYTHSTDFPTTPGAYCETKEDDLDGGFVSELNPDGTTLLHSTLLGRPGTQTWVSDNEMGPNGDVIICGGTSDPEYEVTEDAYGKEFNGTWESFVTVLDANLSRFKYSTFFCFNDTDYDYASLIALSPVDGTLYIAGYTDASFFNDTIGAIDGRNRGSYDSYFIKMDMRDWSLMYGTFLGGNDVDFIGWSPMVVDTSGCLILSGKTKSTDFLTNPNAYDRTYNGNIDSFVVKIDPTPIDVQGPPDNLTCDPGNHSAVLDWDPPGFANCRVYNISVFRGEDPGDLEQIAEVHPKQNWYDDSGLTNGINYYYAVATVNSAGRGPIGEIVNCTPKGLPGPPEGLSAIRIYENGSLNLTWLPPQDDGGTDILGYIIKRGMSSGSLARLETVGNVTWFIDDQYLVLDVFQYYTVQAFNEIGVGPPCSYIRIKPLRQPSPPSGFKANEGDGAIELVWQPPQDTGGCLIIGYKIFKSTNGLDYDELTTVGADLREFTDEDVVNGGLYYYYIRAYANEVDGLPASHPPVIPHSAPGKPRDLEAKAGDGFVILSWRSPEDDGGRPVTGYILYTGQTEANINLPLTLGNETWKTLDDVSNGVTYYFQMVAVNDAGKNGPRSDVASARPLGEAGPPSDLTANSESAGVVLTWTVPEDTGGSLSLWYHVLRGSDADTLELLSNVTGTSYTDQTASGGDVLYYTVQSGNEVGLGERGPVQNVTVLVSPKEPKDLVATGGELEVNLSWSPPDDDGGSAITGYVLKRGTSPTRLTETRELGLVLSHADDQVQPGTQYYYAVHAVNRIGDGELSSIMDAIPLKRPPSPANFTYVLKGGDVVLSWQVPSAFGSATVSGFRLYRGPTSDHMVPLADLGSVTSYTDDGVNEGETYHYLIVPLCEFGEGEPSTKIKVSIEPEPSTSGYLWPLLLAIIVAVVAIALLVVIRGRTRGEEELPAGMVDGDVIAHVPSAGDGIPYFLIEEMFLVYKDGRLVVDCARPECETADADLMSGMLIAVQGLIQDGLERGGALESIKFGTNRVLLASGEHVHVAVVLYGRPTKELMEELQDLVPRIETSYAGRIEEWVGDPDELAGIDEFLAPFLGSTSHLSRDDVMPEETERGVNLLSAIDFHQGYVRLKMAAVNGTDEVIADAAMEFTYNHDMLRLERVEPDSLVVRGDRVFLGSIKPKEKLTVAFMFDPQICQETFIDGMLIFYDPKGELKHVQMKRRHADVVCPIFFTREHANTAMLKRLIKEKLVMSDIRAFSYPQTRPPGEILRLAQSALGEGDMQLVRGFVEEEPPYKAEVWYYAETKVKAYQLVIRLGVLEDSGTLEIYAASTSMEPITGLLADFRRELDRAMEKNYPEGVRMEEVRDDILRMELMMRPLMLDQVADEE